MGKLPTLLPSHEQGPGTTDWLVMKLLDFLTLLDVWHAHSLCILHGHRTPVSGGHLCCGGLLISLGEGLPKATHVHMAFERLPSGAGSCMQETTWFSGVLEDGGLCLCSLPMPTLPFYVSQTHYSVSYKDSRPVGG